MVMIKSFKDALTEAVANGEIRKGFPADLIKVARRKLGYLNAATTLDDLRAPPANRLEALKSDRKGQHSIRVNDQYRICFIWTAEGPKDVEFVDYNKKGGRIPLTRAADAAEGGPDGQETTPTSSRRSPAGRISRPAEYVGRRAGEGLRGSADAHRAARERTDRHHRRHGAAALQGARNDARTMVEPAD